MNTSTKSDCINSISRALMACLFLLSFNSFAQGEPAAKVDFWQPGDPGQRMDIRGQVTSLDGTPIAGASIHIRQADANGMYHSQYSGVVVSNERGIYQFGSVVPGAFCEEKHVDIFVEHLDYQYLSTEILFKDDPNVDGSDPRAVFLEESNVNEESMKFGRFDITLVPN